jgi:hypothetical protein
MLTAKGVLSEAQNAPRQRKQFGLGILNRTIVREPAAERAKGNRNSADTTMRLGAVCRARSSIWKLELAGIHDRGFAGSVHFSRVRTQPLMLKIMKNTRYCLSLLTSIAMAVALPAALSATQATELLNGGGTGPLNFDHWSGGTWGYDFQVGDAPLTVTALGFWDAGHDGLVEAHDVGLWDNSETLLASVHFDAGTPAPDQAWEEFVYLTLNTPLVLNVGDIYYLGATYIVDSDNDGMLADWVYSYGVTPPFSSDVVMGYAKFGYGTTLACPTQYMDYGATVGPTMEYTTTPEPSIGAILMLAFGGFALHVRRRSRRGV